MLNQVLLHYVNWARALYRMWQVVSPEHQRHFRPIQSSLLGSLLKETWAQMSPNHDFELVWCICVFADLKATTRAACVQDAEEAKLLLKLKVLAEATYAQDPKSSELLQLLPNRFVRLAELDDWKHTAFVPRMGLSCVPPPRRRSQDAPTAAGGAGVQDGPRRVGRVVRLHEGTRCDAVLAHFMDAAENRIPLATLQMRVFKVLQGAVGLDARVRTQVEQRFQQAVGTEALLPLFMLGYLLMDEYSESFYNNKDHELLQEGGAIWSALDDAGRSSCATLLDVLTPTLAQIVPEQEYATRMSAGHRATLAQGLHMDGCPAEDYPQTLLQRAPASIAQHTGRDLARIHRDAKVFSAARQLYMDSSLGRIVQGEGAAIARASHDISRIVEDWQQIVTGDVTVPESTNKPTIRVQRRWAATAEEAARLRKFNNMTGHLGFAGAAQVIEKRVSFDVPGLTHMAQLWPLMAKLLTMRIALPEDEGHGHTGHGHAGVDGLQGRIELLQGLVKAWPGMVMWPYVSQFTGVRPAGFFGDHLPAKHPCFGPLWEWYYMEVGLMVGGGLM
jgi:hypothetical protein